MGDIQVSSGPLFVKNGKRPSRLSGWQNLACSQMVTNMLQSLGIYAESKCEVIVIRRIWILIILLALVLLATPEVSAADMRSKAGAVTTGGGNLNVRAQPGSDSPVVASLKKGSYITLLEKSGFWWRVEYGKGKYGYCHVDYITVVQGSPIQVSTGITALNVRSGPGTDYSRVGTLDKGETVLLLKSDGAWSRVLYGGTKTGYVSGKYLSGYYGAVSLGVPDYKQADSRWAETMIGTTGKTIAQIGCATTAIAMMESYRMGNTLRPDAMAKQLRYTDSGNVYWPEHYRTVTAFSLSAIYEKLKQGKPVLLGSRDSYGAQHWVVVTGYKGGSTLTAAGFTINDPGTKYRNNLQQFLDVFPNFYKYFYY